MRLNRRDFIAAGTLAALTRPSGAQEGADRFGHETVRRVARELSARPWVPRVVPETGRRPLDYDLYRAIVFRPDKALWAREGLPFRADFFHAGFFFRRSIEVLEVVDGIAQVYPYDPGSYDFFFGSEDPGDYDIPRNYAGVRLHARSPVDGTFGEFGAFQGASYFRAIARGLRYGLSARAVAIDTGTPRPEEFPDFTTFWLERPAPEATSMRMHALLDGPSLTGAYTFDVSTGDETVVDVSSVLYPRREIGQLGIAPLTSMYHFGSLHRDEISDYRPQVHDSLGLSMTSSTGERSWRPLSNPSRNRIAFLGDVDPRGFGLVQRDRDFSHFLDLEARYDRRPTLAIEPRGSWGKGAVCLFEFPVADETSDNVCAFWVPDGGVGPGRELAFDYRMRWTAGEAASDVARVVGTYGGRGGFANEATSDARKFVIDFEGGALAELPSGTTPTLDLSFSKGAPDAPVLARSDATGGWRVFFDVRQIGPEPLEIRCALRLDGRPLTEIWTYQSIV